MKIFGCPTNISTIKSTNFDRALDFVEHPIGTKKYTLFLKNIIVIKFNNNIIRASESVKSEE